mmetsp:Transcript_57982/g.138045  ORF Transcript_57982/g.138045 Transcript_57982/m.138045 type:complete len:111 (+) Transcript_57982:75-407(+)
MGSAMTCCCKDTKSQPEDTVLNVPRQAFSSTANEQSLMAEFRLMDVSTEEEASDGSHCRKPRTDILMPLVGTGLVPVVAETGDEPVERPVFEPPIWNETEEEGDGTVGQH